jgi:hypothetical protein
MNSAPLSTSPVGPGDTSNPMPQRDGRGSDVAGTSRSTLRREDALSPGKSSLVNHLTVQRQARASGLGPTTYDIEAGAAPGAISAGSSTAVQRKPAEDRSGTHASAGDDELAYLIGAPWQPGLGGDPLVTHLEGFDMYRLLDELSDAVGCGYARQIEPRVSASPRLNAALYAAELARLTRITPYHPALERAAVALDQVPSGMQLQILSWMLQRRGVSMEATTLLEGVLAMREQGAAQPVPEIGASNGSHAPSGDVTSAGTGPMAGATMPSPVEPGPWAPPGDQPGGFYIGNEVHKAIATQYEGLHAGDKVLSNYSPMLSILRALKAEDAAGRLSDAELGMRPDIVNLTRLHLYEIKPATAQALGAAKAALQVGIFGRAGIAMQLGPIGEPGTEGGIPAPGGVCMFWSPQPGVIVYQYRRGRLVPVPLPRPLPVGERRWRFELKPLTREQQQAVSTLTLGGALLLMLMLVLAPVGA